LKHLAELSDRPNPLQEESIFMICCLQQLEVANFSQAEQNSYQDSLKYYRDMNNILDTSRQKGKRRGKELRDRTW
jgi:hypothetical protein